MNLKGNKTTWIGVATVVVALGNAALGYFNNGHVDFGALIASLGAATAAFHAADAKQ